MMEFFQTYFPKYDFFFLLCFYLNLGIAIIYDDISWWELAWLNQIG